MHIKFTNFSLCKSSCSKKISLKTIYRLGAENYVWWGVKVVALPISNQIHKIGPAPVYNHKYLP